jgi:hypothetical protein
MASYFVANPPMLPWPVSSNKHNYATSLFRLELRGSQPFAIPDPPKLVGVMECRLLN